MSDDDVEETEFLDDAEALFGSRFLGGSNHCPTIPGQHSKALKDPHDPYKSVCSKSAVKVLTQVSCIDYDILDHNGMLVHAQWSSLRGQDPTLTPLAASWFAG